MSKKQLNIDPILNELRGQSVFFDRPEIVRREKSNGDKLPDLRTSEVTNSGTSGHTNLQTYELRNYAKWWRLDLRLTEDQKRYLFEVEEAIRIQRPEGERNNPKYKRITKNSIIRVFIEIFRQLDLRVEASQFKNEHDYLKALITELHVKLPDLRSSELTD